MLQSYRVHPRHMKDDPFPNFFNRDNQDLEISEPLALLHFHEVLHSIGKAQQTNDRSVVLHCSESQLHESRTTVKFNSPSGLDSVTVTRAMQTSESFFCCHV